jgi:hypothetical protein
MITAQHPTPQAAEATATHTAIQQAEFEARKPLSDTTPMKVLGVHLILPFPPTHTQASQRPPPLTEWPPPSPACHPQLQQQPPPAWQLLQPLLHTSLQLVGTQKPHESHTIMRSLLSPHAHTQGLLRCPLPRPLATSSCSTTTSLWLRSRSRRGSRRLPAWLAGKAAGWFLLLIPHPVAPGVHPEAA